MIRVEVKPEYEHEDCDMNFNLTIKYRKPSRQEFMLWLILILPFTFGTLTDLLGLPDFIKYVCDLCWLGLLARMIFQVPRMDKPVKRLLLWSGLFLLMTLFVYIFNFQSPLYYLWGMRNNFRFYVFFFALIVYFRKEYVETVLKLFDVLFWINAAVSLVQFFAFDIQQDYLGGVFGTTKGVNGYTNIFFLIVAARSIIYYLNHRESLLKCVAKCGTALIVAAMAELKFFYVEFAVVIVVASLITKFSWKKLLIIVGGFVGLSLTASLLVKLFPVFEDFLSIDKILENAGSNRGYTGSGDLNRLTAIPLIISYFFKSLLQQIFGLGLGNCETGSYAFLNTPFFMQYGWLHYNWISIAHMFLENGFAGLIFFLGFFVLTYFLCGSRKNANVQDRMYIQITKVISVCSVMIAVYNASLRQESSYMLYFVLALGFIANRKTVPPLPKARRLMK